MALRCHPLTLSNHVSHPWRSAFAKSVARRSSSFTIWQHAPNHAPVRKPQPVSDNPIACIVSRRVGFPLRCPVLCMPRRCAAIHQSHPITISRQVAGFPRFVAFTGGMNPRQPSIARRASSNTPVRKPSEGISRHDSARQIRPHHFCADINAKTHINSPSQNPRHSGQIPRRKRNKWINELVQAI
jgi:hypothetical protein